MTGDRVKTCEYCGAEFSRGRVSNAQWEARRFCSPKCKASLIRGKSDKRPDETTLRDLYESQRLTTHHIGDRYGVPHISVCRWLKFYGIERRPGNNGLLNRGVTPPTADELRRMIHVEHMSYETVASRYGVDLTAVPYWLDKHGIPRPKAWDTRRNGDIPVMPDAETLAMLYREHKNLDTVGKLFGVSGGTMAKLCDEYGIKKRRTSLPDAETLRTMYESGMTCEQIGGELNYSWARIAGLLAEYGIERRPAGFNGGRRYTCDDGQVVLSVYEQRVCNWLNARSVPYVYEPTLPWGHRARADFLVNGWYIEIWGVGDKHYKPYRERMARKLTQYKARGLPLIQVFRRTFDSAERLDRRLAKCLSPAPTPLPLAFDS